MRLNIKNYSEILYKLVSTSDGKTLKNELYSFVELLASSHKLSMMPRIIDAFTQIYYKKQKISKAQIISKTPMSKSHKEEIIKYIENKTKKTVELHEQINKKMLGGFVLTYDDKRIDTTITTTLKSLRHHLKMQ